MTAPSFSRTFAATVLAIFLVPVFYVVVRKFAKKPRTQAAPRPAPAE